MKLITVVNKLRWQIFNFSTPLAPNLTPPVDSFTYLITLIFHLHSPSMSVYFLNDLLSYYLFVVFIIIIISILLFQGCVRTLDFQAHLVYEGKFEVLIKRERCGIKKWPLSSLVPVLKPSSNPSLLTVLATRKLSGNKFMYLVHHLLGRTLQHTSDCIQRMVVST